MKTLQRTHVWFLSERARNEAIHGRVTALENGLGAVPMLASSGEHLACANYMLAEKLPTGIIAAIEANSTNLPDLPFKSYSRQSNLC